MPAGMVILISGNCDAERPSAASVIERVTASPTLKPGNASPDAPSGHVSVSVILVAGSHGLLTCVAGMVLTLIVNDSDRRRLMRVLCKSEFLE